VHAYISQKWPLSIFQVAVICFALVSLYQISLAPFLNNRSFLYLLILNDELRTVHISDPENVCVILEKDNHAIVMVGDKNIVQMLCRDVRRILSNVEGKKLAF
jgi:hypothetical protein